MLVSPEDPAGSCEHLGHGSPSTFTGVAGIASYRNSLEIFRNGKMLSQQKFTWLTSPLNVYFDRLRRAIWDFVWIHRAIVMQTRFVWLESVLHSLHLQLRRNVRTVMIVPTMRFVQYVIDYFGEKLFGKIICY